MTYLYRNKTWALQRMIIYTGIKKTSTLKNISAIDSEKDY